jgi:hypothetical protein
MTVSNLLLKLSIVNFILLGPFFANWMECEVQEECLKNPPRNHETLCLKKNTGHYPSILDKLSQFCVANFSDGVTVQRHHITLRSMLESLPLLSNKGGSDNGLCGCLVYAIKISFVYQVAQNKWHPQYFRSLSLRSHYLDLNFFFNSSSKALQNGMFLVTKIATVVF